MSDLAPNLIVRSSLPGKTGERVRVSRPGKPASSQGTHPENSSDTEPDPDEPEHRLDVRG